MQENGEPWARDLNGEKGRKKETLILFSTWTPRAAGKHSDRSCWEETSSPKRGKKEENRGKQAHLYVKLNGKPVSKYPSIKDEEL